MPSTAEKKRIVTHFLARCNAYAKERIEHYRGQLSVGDAMDALAIQDKIGHWSAYQAFNEHTIEELAADTLDDWFES
ncbi:MAG: hypothetical protein OEQ74_00800 [Gammaproteobacteria bacterium]|nr:hypothetical protein [Gammaproteobacteria bacterium]